MPVLVVANRRARHLARPGPILEALREPRAGVRVVETGSLAELDRVAAAVAVERPSAIVLAGGDGSYTAGLTALGRTLGEEALAELPIALAPGGTACTVPRDWDWKRGDAVARTRAVFAALGRLRTTPRPTLRIRDAAGEAPRLGFIFGAGLVARFFELYDAQGARGELGAAKIVARVFVGSFLGGRTASRVLTPTDCAIEVDGAPAPFGRVSLVGASVIRDLGLHMRLLYRAAERPDRFHLVATPVSPRRLGPQMPRVLAGRPLRDPKIDTLAAILTLRFPSGTGAYVLDGELLRGDFVEVTAGPTLRVVDVA